MEQRIILSSNLQQELAIAISECEHDKTFVLTDETTAETCWPVVRDFMCLRGANIISIPATDAHKDLNAICQVWEELSKKGASRHSLLINLGGGMVTDLGGFAASTFKRGIDFINIPTTLLAMVDASVGGKTGINFCGLKNEIGVFNNARFVILDTKFLRTLDHQNICSGYAEMLKHGLISFEKMWADLVNFDLAALNIQQKSDNLQQLLDQLKLMVGASVKVKENVVETDPYEHGLRKALNLGHTFGHAFESFALKKAQEAMKEGKEVDSLLHGYAVAFGLVCELYLSAIKCGFPQDKLRQTVSFIKENYGSYSITCDDYTTLIELMTHDKKNKNGIINFTLLGEIGDIQINQQATEEEIREALDFFREG